MSKAQLISMLSEGERKAIARSGEVAQMVLVTPSLLSPLIQALESEDTVIVAHASHALFSVFKAGPNLLNDWVVDLVRLYHRSQWEILEQLGKILPAIVTAQSDVRAVAARAEAIFHTSGSGIARTCALQCLVDLAQAHSALMPTARAILVAAQNSDSKALQARARRLKASIPL